jgi:hypothetical protein
VLDDEREEEGESFFLIFHWNFKKIFQFSEEAKTNHL